MSNINTSYIRLNLAFIQGHSHYLRHALTIVIAGALFIIVNMYAQTAHANPGHNNDGDTLNHELEACDGIRIVAGDIWHL